MTAPELDAFLGTQRTARVATVDAKGRPHVTPLWFVWHDGSLWMSSLVRSSRFAHLTEHPEAAAVVDGGDAYDELQGVEVRGPVRIVGEVPRVGDPDAELAPVEALFAAKYRPGQAIEPDGRHAWVALRPRTVVSWDFRKLS